MLLVPQVHSSRFQLAGQLDELVHDDKLATGQLVFIDAVHAAQPTNRIAAIRPERMPIQLDVRPTSVLGAFVHVDVNVI